MGSVTGRDFSRAARNHQKPRALAPAGCNFRIGGDTSATKTFGYACGHSSLPLRSFMYEKVSRLHGADYSLSACVDCGGRRR